MYINIRFENCGSFFYDEKICIGVNFVQIVGAHGPSLPLLSPSLFSLIPLLSLPLSLEVGPPNPARGSGGAL